MGNLLCIGLFDPTGGADLSNDRLTAGVDVDVLDVSPLLPFLGADLVFREGAGSRQLVGLRQVFHAVR